MPQIRLFVPARKLAELTGDLIVSHADAGLRAGLNIGEEVLLQDPDGDLHVAWVTGLEFDLYDTRYQLRLGPRLPPEAVPGTALRSPVGLERRRSGAGAEAPGVGGDAFETVVAPGADEGDPDPDPDPDPGHGGSPGSSLEELSGDDAETGAGAPVGTGGDEGGRDLLTVRSIVDLLGELRDLGYDPD